MTTESEEFEFRLRAEQEAGGGNPSPLQNEKSIGAPQQEPAFEREAREIRDTTGAELASANPMVRVLTSAAQPIMGAGELIEKTYGGTKIRDTRKDLSEMQRKGAQALGFSKGETMAADLSGAVLSAPSVAAMKAPAAASAAGRVAQGAGFGGVSGLTSEGDSPITSGGVGAAAGAGITAAIEGLLKTPGAVGALVKAVPSLLGFGAPKAAPKAPTTAGAEKALGELQMQRDVMSGAPARSGKDASEFERASTDFGERMKPLREEAFSAGSVSGRETVNMLDGLIAKNPDAKVRRALEEVKGTISRATEGSQAASLPAAGSRLTVEQLRAAQGQGERMSVEMADEVRQSINRMISQKGDNALDSYTQKLLGDVRDNLVGRTPDAYKRYLEQYSKGAKTLDPYQPDANVIGRVTSEGGARPVGTDAQNALETVFAGKTPERDFRQLVENTRHNPEALNGVREAYRKWVMPADASGKVDVAKAAAHWAQSKAAAQNSGLFEPNHFTAIDKVVTGLTNAEKGAEAVKAGAAGAAWVLGLPFGRPGSTAMLARTAVGRMGGSEKTPQQVEGLIQKMMQDAEFARLAAASPTQQNIQAVERAMGAVAGERAAEPAPKRRRSSPFSMQPAGL